MDSRIKRIILGKRAAEWTRIVIGARAPCVTRTARILAGPRSRLLALFRWASRAEECGLQGRTTPAALEEAWERNLMALYPSAAVLPGVERLTAHLAARGVPMAVATSSSAKALAAKRTPHGALFARFAAFVTAEDVARGKPAPDAFLAAAAKLGVPPAECVVFEDAQSGVEAGLAAGCVVVAVPDATLHDSVEGFKAAQEVLRSLDDFDPAAWGLPPYPAN